jgi:hypothetical protein
MRFFKIDAEVAYWFADEICDATMRPMKTTAGPQKILSVYYLITLL